MQRKYGIWILPSGESNKQLQSLINEIADDYNAIKFIPHVSIAGVLIRDEELDLEKEKVNRLADRLNRFSMTLDEIGIKDEKHRCIYLLAKSNFLENVFKETTVMFPEAMIERNRTMPHLSIMYGEYPDKIKREIISKNPDIKLTFEAEGLDLCLSDGPEEGWHSIYHAAFPDS